MLKSCKHCGKIHDSKFDCSMKPKGKKQGNNKDKFRWTQVWQRKRKEIKKRDLYLCQVCIRKLYDTDNQYTYEDLEVHHAVPLDKDFEKRLDDGNLITLCGRHHEMAEGGKIPFETVQAIIFEQERTVTNGGTGTNPPPRGVLRFF